MLRKNDVVELLKTGVLIDCSDEDLVSNVALYRVANGYEIDVLCEDWADNTWEKVVHISCNRDTNEIYISNSNYWLENIIKIKILKVIETFEK
jgi:hypothetical protein